MPSATPKRPTKPKPSPFKQSLGRRTSARQRERQARLQAIEEERHAAAQHEGKYSVSYIMSHITFII